MRARRALLAPLAMLALSAGCQGIEAKQAAIKQLENGGQSQGLSELEVFGRSEAPVFEWVAAGSASYEQNKNAPGAFVVTIPYWGTGKLPDGRTVSRKREVTMDMVNRGGWQVERQVISRDEELTTLRQIASWLGWSAILPAFLLLWVASYNLENMRALAAVLSPAALQRILAIFSLLVSAYVAYLCFGTLLAVFVCPLVQLTATAMLIGIVRGRKRRSA